MTNFRESREQLDESSHKQRIPGCWLKAHTSDCLHGKPWRQKSSNWPGVQSRVPRVARKAIGDGALSGENWIVTASLEGQAAPPWEDGATVLYAKRLKLAAGQRSLWAALCVASDRENTAADLLREAGHEQRNS